MKTEVLNALKERRSVRKYLPDQIRPDQLDAVLEAGIYAPNGMGKQSAKIVVIQDKETIAELSKLNATVMGKDTDPFYGAPTLLVVFADKNIATWHEDGSLVLGNLQNAAYAAGLGSCWIHRAHEVFEMPEGKALMAKWGLSDDYIGVGNCILGYPSVELPAAKPRKDDYIIRV